MAPARADRRISRLWKTEIRLSILTLDVNCSPRLHALRDKDFSLRADEFSHEIPTFDGIPTIDKD